MFDHKPSLRKLSDEALRDVAEESVSPPVRVAASAVLTERATQDSLKRVAAADGLRRVRFEKNAPDYPWAVTAYLEGFDRGEWVEVERSDGDSEQEAYDYLEELAPEARRALRTRVTHTLYREG